MPTRKLKYTVIGIYLDNDQPFNFHVKATDSADALQQTHSKGSVKVVDILEGHHDSVLWDIETTNPLIVKAFEASTAHISKEDDALLRLDRQNAVAVYEVNGGGTCYGYLVYTGLEDDLEDFLGTTKPNNLEKAGFSQAFCNLMELARKFGCKFLQLDCDGIEYDDLPKFEW